MEFNPLKIPISTISGIMAIIIFCALVLASMSLYPQGFSPVDNWISDLGNPNLNPSGATFFNGACIITGGLMIIFYAGFYRWYSFETWRNAFIALAQIAGIVSGLSLVMVGIYPEIFEQHLFWASALFVSSLVAMLLANAGLFTHLDYDSVTAYSGLIAVALSLVFVIAMALSIEVPIFEWLAVGMMMIWVAFVACNMYNRLISV